MKNLISRFLLLSSFSIAVSGTGRAEDIDIFSGVAAASGSVPQILFVIDSRSSNDASVSPYTCPVTIPSADGKMLGMLQCALYMAINSISSQPALLGNLRIGLMHGGSSSNKYGEMMRPSSSPWTMELMDNSGIANWKTYLTDPNTDIKSSGNSPIGSMMQEAWAFYTGHTGGSGTTYTAHLGGTTTCQKTYIVLIGNVDPKHTSSNDAGGDFADLLAAIPTPTAAQQQQINTSSIGPNTGQDGSTIDEWARYLHQTDFGTQDDSQTITTYAIGAYGSDGLWPDKSQQMKSTALQGGGAYFLANTLDGFVQAILQIFNEVAAVNSVFASSSLPVSANAQGTYQNQVFIGMFRPDGSDAPRWMGNLKQYQFGVDATNPADPKLFLADSRACSPSIANCAALSSSGSGFISPNAVSFWTSKNLAVLPDKSPPGGFWVNNPQGIGMAFDSPDGQIVEKGGVGQQLRLENLQDDYTQLPGSSQNPRRLYTCNGSCAMNVSLSASPFATTNSNIDLASLGITGTSSSVSSISRNGTTVTMVLSAAPSPALTGGQAVTVTGSSNIEINGTFPITLDPVTPQTKFTYTIVESAPTPSTGTYTASIPASPATVTSITRGGTNGTVATVTTSTNHGFTAGQKVTIIGANQSEYNGQVTVAAPVTGTSFTYTIVPGPAAVTGVGTASIGASNLNLQVGWFSVDSAIDSTSPYGRIVTINTGATLPAAFVGGAMVTIANVSPSQHNGIFQILYGKGSGGSCPGLKKQDDNNAFCYKVATPATPATGTITADPSAAVSVTFAHTTSCTGGSPTPTDTVTATTVANAALPATFVNGAQISITGSPGTRESKYIGNNIAIGNVNTSTGTFTFSMTTTPPCAPGASGVSVSTSANAIGRDSLINWVRGQDSLGDEPSPGSGITIRPSVHGDVLHSRPSTINYGGSTGVVVYYGSNDGTFRAINGNKTGNIGTVRPGGELWSFIPTEFFAKLKREYSNSPPLKLALTPTGITPTPAPKDYYFDGVTGIYHNTTVTPAKAYIFLSARRGGRLIYALDVSDPQDPRFMWKVGCPNLTNNTGCTSGFDTLGQTWSTPKAMTVKGSANPVLIFGGGYDPNEDSEPPATPGASNPQMGNSIFILDATNGNILWQATSGGGADRCTGTPCSLQNMTYSIPSDAALMDRDQDGFVDRIYIPDMGGNIWRIDTEPAGGNTPGFWQATKIAAVGGAGSTKRKIMYPPDVVVTPNFDLVLTGTGDREHPLYANASLNIINRFYGIKDLNTGKDGTIFTTVVDATSSTANAVPPALFNANAGPYDLSLSGFYFTLPNTGEKIVNAPKTVGSFTFFGTSTPTAPANLSCSNNLGVARGYQINYLTGATNSQVFDGGGLPPSPVTGQVTVPVNGVDKTLTFVIGGIDPGKTRCVGADCNSSLGGIQPTPPITPLRKRVYWYNQKQDK